MSVRGPVDGLSLELQGGPVAGSGRSRPRSSSHVARRGKGSRGRAGGSRGAFGYRAPDNAAKVARRVYKVGGRSPKRRVRTPYIEDARVLEQKVAEKLMGKFSKVQQAFRAFDADKSGKVSKTEFRRGLASMGFAVTEDQLDIMARTLDTDKDGEIDYREFAHHVSEILRPSEDGIHIRKNLLNYSPKKPDAAGTVVKVPTPVVANMLLGRFAEKAVGDFNHVVETFKRYDHYGKGYITRGNFRRALAECGIVLSDMQAKRLMPVYDSNKDGRVQYTEFVAALSDGIKSRLAADARMQAKQARGKLMGATAPAPTVPTFHFPTHKPRRGARPTSGNKVMAEPASGPLQSANDVEQLMANKLFNKFAKVQQAFRLFDDDKSGSVSAQEFRTALETMGFEMTNAEFGKLLQKYDVNGDGNVSYVEFNNNVGKLVHEQGRKRSVRPGQATMETATQAQYKSGTQSKGGSSLASWVELRFAKTMLKGLENAEEAFHRMDSNSDGVLSEEEFRRGIYEAGFKLTRTQLKALIKKFDRDGKGHISLSDFRREFQHHFPRAPGMGRRGKKERLKAMEASRHRAPLTLDDSVNVKFTNKLMPHFRKVQNAFRVLDPEGTGTLSYEDFRKALSVYGCPIADKDFRAFAAVYDRVGSGRISYREFNNHIAQKVQPMANNVVVSEEVGRDGPIPRKEQRARGFASWLERKFAQLAIHQVQHLVDDVLRFDKRHTGRISCKVFLEELRRAGFSFTTKEKRHLLKRFDTNNDGFISVAEFTSFFNGLLRNPAGVTALGHTRQMQRPKSRHGLSARSGAGAGDTWATRVSGHDTRARPKSSNGLRRSRSRGAIRTPRPGGITRAGSTTVLRLDSRSGSRSRRDPAVSSERVSRLHATAPMMSPIQPSGRSRSRAAFPEVSP